MLEKYFKEEKKCYPTNCMCNNFKGLTDEMKKNFLSFRKRKGEDKEERGEGRKVEMEVGRERQLETMIKKAAQNKKSKYEAK